MSLSQEPDNNSKLKIYALFKQVCFISTIVLLIQATAGDAHADRPGAANFMARAKYDAWNKLKGVSEVFFIFTNDSVDFSG